MLHKYAYLTIWLFFFGLFVSILAELTHIGLLTINNIMSLDNTGTTLFIIFVFLTGIAFSISNIVWLTRLATKTDNELVESADSIELSFQYRQTIMGYIIGYLPILGFLGTLIGFMIIATIFETKIAGETDLIKIVSHIQDSVGGIKTAAFTSIVGLVTSWSCLLLLDVVYKLGYMRLVVAKVNKKDQP